MVAAEDDRSRGNRFAERQDDGLAGVWRGSGTAGAPVGRGVCLLGGRGARPLGRRARRGDAPGRRGTGTYDEARAISGVHRQVDAPARRGTMASWRRTMAVRLRRNEARAEGLRAFAERERVQRATSKPAEEGARRAAERAAAEAKQQPARELEREAGNVARWKAAKAARVARGARANDADTYGAAGAAEGRRRQQMALVAETIPVPTTVKVSDKHTRTAAAMFSSREEVMDSIRETRAGAMERT